MWAGLTLASVPHAPAMSGLCFPGRSASACARLASTAKTDTRALGYKSGIWGDTVMM